MNREIICCICRKRFTGDGEPVCNDPACQAFAEREYLHREAVQAAEQILLREWMYKEATEYGL